MLYPNIMGSMNPEQGGGGVGSEGSRVHNNVINMIIAKEQTEFVDNKEKSTPLVVLIRIKMVFQLQQ